MRRHRLLPALPAFTFVLFFLILSSPLSHAQTSVTGYIQAEWQHYDQSSNPDSRAIYYNSRKNFFTIRRGRTKFTHQDSAFRAVLEVDFTERGAALKDAYLEVSLLERNLLNVWVGLTKRPNYEAEMSSSVRESPERSQVVRAFYPGERDLGFKFESMPKLGENITPKIQLAMFNGTTEETDPLKDIIGRVTLPLPLGEDSKVQATIGGSYYLGGVPQPDDTIITYENGARALTFEERSGSWAGWGNRSNAGVEAQVDLALLPFGKTGLRGEFLTGKRPEAVTRSAGDSTDLTVPTLIVRNQMGYYVTFIQELGKKFTLAAKYDFFDRNTDVTGTEVNSTRDRASSVFGFGLLGNFGPVRITAWYEIPTYAADEARYVTESGATASDDLKDNKTTIRFQYKFR